MHVQDTGTLLCVIVTYCGILDKVTGVNILVLCGSFVFWLATCMYMHMIEVHEKKLKASVEELVLSFFGILIKKITSNEHYCGFRTDF